MIRKKCRQVPWMWHKWFAWHPIWLGYEYHGSQYCQTMVWWEWVWRIYERGYDRYSLTEPKDDQTK